jgi:hypothetical protein
MDIRRGLMNIANHLPYKHLATLTFTNVISRDAVTLVPQADWVRYDYLLFVPNLTVTPQEGETSGNWLYYSITDGTKSHSNRSTDGTTRPRTKQDSMMLVHDNGEWILASIIDGKIWSAHIESEAVLSNITVKFGTFYGLPYGYFNGTMDVYGGTYIK